MGIWDDLKDAIADLNEYLKRNETVGDAYKKGAEMFMKQSQMSDYSSMLSRYGVAKGIEGLPALKNWITGDKETIKKYAYEVVKGMSDEVNKLTKAYNNEMEETLMKYDDIMRNISINIGATSANTSTMKVNMEMAYKYAAQLGMSFETIKKYQTEFNEELRTSAPLLKNEIEMLSKIETATGYDKFNKIAFDVLKYGNSMQNIDKTAKSILERTAMGGVNLRNVLKSLDGSIKDAQKVNFQNGLQGLAKMVVEAEKLKVNLNEAFSGMDRAKELEGAFEMATELQLLGKNVDALELNFLANTDPEGFMRKMNELVGGIGMLNKNTGEMLYTPVDNKILAQIAKSSGMSLENLKEQRAEQFKISEIRRQNVSLTEEEASFVAKMSRYEDGRYKIIDAQGQLISAQVISSKEIAELMKSQTDVELRAKDSMGFADYKKSAELVNEAVAMADLDLTKRMENFKESISEAVTVGLGMGMSSERAEAFARTFTVAMYKETKKAEETFAKENPIATAIQKMFGEPMYEKMFGDKYSRSVDAVQPPSTSGSGGSWFDDLFSSNSLTDAFDGMAMNAGKGIKDGLVEATPELAKALKTAIKEGFSEAKGMASNINVSVGGQKADKGLLDRLNGVIEGMRTKGYDIG